MANTSATKPREDNGPMSGPAVDRLRDASSQAVSQAEDALHSVGQMASNALPAAGQVIGQTADNLATAAGGRLKGLGETMARNTPKDGLLGTASQTVAQGLEKGGDYLSREGISGLAGDVTDLIRRNPVPAVLLGLGIGFLIGRLAGSRG